jgi:hypothetical protein
MLRMTISSSYRNTTPFSSEYVETWELLRQRLYRVISYPYQERVHLSELISYAKRSETNHF